MLNKAYIIFRDFARQMRVKNVSAFSASTAFFFFVSLVPMLILICTVIPYTTLTQQDLAAAITVVMPERVDSLIVLILQDVYEKSAGVMSLAAVATLWSAGKGMLALMHGLNAVYDVVEERNYFLVRLIASLYTLVMLVVLLVSLFLLGFGKLPVLTLLFMGLYTYVPNVKLKFWEQFPGALFSAVVWSLYSWGFSLYLNRTGAYGTYGNLSIIVIAMLWLYFCMYIIMIGAHLNRYCRISGKEINK